MRRILALLLSVLVLAGCDLPKDPEGTVKEIRGGLLRVGELPGNQVALNVDRQVAERLAEELDAQVTATTGETHDLVRALSEGEIDLIIGGLPASTPFVKEIGLSNPVGPLPGVEGEDRVVGIVPGENAFLMEVNKAIRAVRGETS